MKIHLKLALALLFLSMLPIFMVYAVSPPYTVANVQTFANGPCSGPCLAYIDGKVILNFAPGWSSYGGGESTDGGRTWNHFSMTGLPSGAAGSFQFPMLPDPTHPHRLIGLVNNDQQALVSCIPTLVYSDDYGRHWTTTGTLSGQSGYGYTTVYGGCVTSDSFLIFSSAFGRDRYSGTNFGVFTWTCLNGVDPTVPGNWHISNPVGGSMELDEPSVADLGGGHVLMTMRTRIGQAGFAHSYDHGGSWGAVEYHGVPNSDQPPTLVKVSSSRLMIAYDNTGTLGVRRPLVVAVSDDNGGSWGQSLQVADDGSGRAVCYPVLCKTSNGEIGIGWWGTDISGQGGSHQGEKCMFAILVPTSQQGYEVTVKAYCDSEGVSLTTLQVTGTGGAHWSTEPFTVSVVSGGSFTCTVPSTDPNGDAFRSWSTGSTSTTLTVTSGDTYTAYYGVQKQDNMFILEVAFGIGASILIIALVVTRTGLLHTRGKGRRHR